MGEGALAGCPVRREAASAMLPRGSGCAAFAGAVQAPRTPAQSMARELDPECIHVPHVATDVAIYTAFIRDGILDPESIAGPYWQLHRKPRNTWVHKPHLRPWGRAIVGGRPPLELGGTGTSANLTQVADSSTNRSTSD